MVADQSSRKRSPNFPSSPLGEAINRLLTLYEKEKNHPIDRDAAAKALGYSGINNSAASRMIASMLQFGLVERVSDGSVKVSQLGLMIVKPIDNAEKQKAIALAFRKPGIFDLLIDQYGDDLTELPSETTIQNRLIREMGFFESAAESCVNTFLESFRYTNEMVTIKKEDIKTDEPGSDEVFDEKPTSDRKDQPLRAKESAFSLSGPLSTKAMVSLSVTGPVGRRELERLKGWLTGVATQWVQFAIEDHHEEEIDEKATLKN